MFIPILHGLGMEMAPEILNINLAKYAWGFKNQMN